MTLMADSSISAATPRSSAPVSTPAGAAARPSAGGGATTAPEAGGDAFGPAVVVGGGAPPSVFSVYTAQGKDAAKQPTLRVSAPTVSHGGQVPSSTMYERLGRIVYQIQLAFRGGGLGSSYTLGYSVIV